MTEPNPLCEHCSSLAAERDALSLENERLVNALAQLNADLCIDRLRVEILEAQLADARSLAADLQEQIEWTME